MEAAARAARGAPRVRARAAAVVQRSRRPRRRARAAASFRTLNASYERRRRAAATRASTSGIAVATDDALLVPTIFDADRKSMFEIAADRARLAEQVRSAGRSAPGELARRHVHRLEPRHVRRAPLHRRDQPPAGRDPRRRRGRARGRRSATTAQLVARRLMDVALSCDHRVVYGAEAAQLPAAPAQTLLEQPTLLVVD